MNVLKYAVSSSEEVDGSSPYTQSTPFLSPSTVWGQGAGFIWILDNWYCFTPGRGTGPETGPSTPPPLPVFTKGQMLNLRCLFGVGENPKSFLF